MSQTLTSTKPRFSSIDIVRGAVMLIMAIDHVRDFFHLTAMTDQPTNLATTTPVLFMTRFITHFCAPSFVFLSGVSAFISGQRKTPKERSIFLIKRGCWLVFIEVVVVSFGITFNPSYNFILLQVIWAIGWSMIILGLLTRLPMKWILAIGLLIFFGHNILDTFSLPRAGVTSIVWKVLLTSPGQPYFPDPSHMILVAYSILPWTGIMLLGYVLGDVYKNGYDAERRRKILGWLGCGLLLLFVVLRLINSYGDPAPWEHRDNAVFSFLSFLNVTKYPPSLQYGCLTLGVALLALSGTEKWSGRLSNFLSLYGRVPFFYYILHFYLAHMIVVLLFFASGHTMNQVNDPASFIFFRPASEGLHLWQVYIIWLVVVLSLYYPCRWYDRYKRSHRQWWLSYI